MQALEPVLSFSNNKDHTTEKDPLGRNSLVSVAISYNQFIVLETLLLRTLKGEAAPLAVLSAPSDSSPCRALAHSKTACGHTKKPAAKKSQNLSCHKLQARTGPMERVDIIKPCNDWRSERHVPKSCGRDYDINRRLCAQIN